MFVPEFEVKNDIISISDFPLLEARGIMQHKHQLWEMPLHKELCIWHGFK